MTEKDKVELMRRFEPFGREIPKDQVMSVIARVPTTDRPKGKWIEINNGADTTCECSECHHRDYIPNVKTEQNKYECMDRYWFERNFCPNCGADMRGEDE